MIGFCVKCGMWVDADGDECPSCHFDTVAEDTTTLTSPHKANQTMTITDVLSSFPSLRGDAEYTDSDALSDLKGWAEAARTVLETVTGALERAGAGSNFQTISYIAENRNELQSKLTRVDAALRDAGAPMDELTTDQGAEWVRRELAAQRQRADGNAAAIGDAEREAAALRTKCEALALERDEALEIARRDARQLAEVHQTLGTVLSQTVHELDDRNAYIEALEVEIQLLENRR